MALRPAAAAPGRAPAAVPADRRHVTLHHIPTPETFLQPALKPSYNRPPHRPGQTLGGWTLIMPEPRPARPLLEALRTADWLTHDRAVAWSIILLIEELLIVGFLALWQHGVFVAVHNPPSSDFVSFYAAGKLTLAGTPALAYDPAAHYLAEQSRGCVRGAGYQYFFYPPVFLLLCAALATLPYFVSYALFQVATLLPFILVMRAVLRARTGGWCRRCWRFRRCSGHWGWARTRS